MQLPAHHPAAARQSTQRHAAAARCGTAHPRPVRPLPCYSGSNSRPSSGGSSNGPPASSQFPSHKVQPLGHTQGALAADAAATVSPWEYLRIKGEPIWYENSRHALFLLLPLFPSSFFHCASIAPSQRSPAYNLPLLPPADPPRAPRPSTPNPSQVPLHADRPIMDPTR